MSLSLFAYQIAIAFTFVASIVLGFFEVTGVEVEGFFRTFICRAFPNASGC